MASVVSEEFARMADSSKFGLIRFVKDKVVKVARSDQIRYEDTKEPFEPASCEDFPTRSVEAKWQPSMTNEDFSNEGYWEAEVLAITGKF